MEFSRKVQVTGAGDTRIISLPKDWAERHQLTKGSNIVIKELSTGDLIIYPQKSPIPSKRISNIVESNHVSRDVLGAYLLGSDIIAVRSPDIKQPLTHKAAIKELTRQLVGLEILGETQRSIELHFLIDSSSLPDPTEYVNRCFSIANQMQSDAINAFLEGDVTLAVEVIERDVEVNRLYFLIVRMLKIMVNDKREMSYLKSTACLDWRMIASYSEDLGDSSVEFARVVKKYPEMKDALSSDTLSKISRLSELTTDVLNQSLVCFFEQNGQGAEQLKGRIRRQLTGIHEEVEREISRLAKEDVWKLTYLLNFLRDLRETAIDIGDLVHESDANEPENFSRMDISTA
ncbi:MAG: PhoU domain-containing protein [Candidatus Heimdallarchaeota archaeon]